MYDSLPEVIESALLLAENIFASSSRSLNPLGSRPTNTPMAKYSSASNSSDVAHGSALLCNTTYPTWSTSPCYGSNDRVSTVEIPNAAESTLSCPMLKNDPYAADVLAPGVGVPHRSAGTCEFATNARAESDSCSESELSDHASWNFQPSMTITHSSSFLKSG